MTSCFGALVIATHPHTAAAYHAFPTLYTFAQFATFAATSATAYALNG